jgi:hypothetical protein
MSIDIAVSWDSTDARRSSGTADRPRNDVPSAGSRQRVWRNDAKRSPSDASVKASRTCIEVDSKQRTAHTVTLAVGASPSPVEIPALL